jgi:hypothetical protein
MWTWWQITTSQQINVKHCVDRTFKPVLDSHMRNIHQTINNHQFKIVFVRWESETREEEILIFNNYRLWFFTFSSSTIFAFCWCAHIMSTSSRIYILDSFKSEERKTGFQSRILHRVQPERVSFVNLLNFDFLEWV